MDEIVNEVREETFGDRVRLLRNLLGLSLKELGDRVGVAKTTIAGWETQGKFPDEARLKKLAEALGTTPDALIGIEKEKLEEKIISKDTFIMKLLKQCVEEGIIKDPDNIDRETLDMIINAVKIEIKRIQKDI